MIEIKFPEGDEFVDGSKCLELEIPWQTEGSIVKEDEVLNENDYVLEVGTGGSTLFFARRCGRVTAIETNPEWAAAVHRKVITSDPDIENVMYIQVSGEAEIIDIIQKMDTTNITVVSIDPDGQYNRSAMLNAFLGKEISPNLRMLVVDNYAHEGIFPDHYDKIIIDSPEWEVFTYDHERWAGNGTRLYIKKQL